MIIKFKVNFNSSKDQWIGWFGEDVMKLKLNSNQENFVNDLTLFLHLNLGIKKEDMKVVKIDQQHRLAEIEFPDTAWELFLSAIEK